MKVKTKELLGRFLFTSTLIYFALLFQRLIPLHSATNCIPQNFHSQSYIPKVTEEVKNTFSQAAVKEESKMTKYGNSLRAFASALANLKLGKGSRRELESEFERMRQSLFGFLSPEAFNVNVTDRAGIVMCVGNGKKDMGIGNGDSKVPNFAMAMSTIKSIRFILNSTLPIEIFYLGDNDLSLNERNELLTISDLTVQDLSPFITKQDSIKGWNIKPFAMLISSFRHVILMDLDVVFLQKPDRILQYPKYVDAGALFFHDRTFGARPKSVLNKINELVTKPSEVFSNLKLMRGKTMNEMESGLVVIDKYRHLAGLVAVCKFLDPDARIFRHPEELYGDKEYFWIGFAIVEEEFAFANDYKTGESGVAKTFQKDGETFYRICSKQIFHVDEFDRPLWINGGLSVNKNFAREKHHLADIKEYFTEGTEVKFKDFCYESKQEPNQLEQSTIKLIKESGKLYLEALNNQK